MIVSCLDQKCQGIFFVPILLCYIILWLGQPRAHGRLQCLVFPRLGRRGDACSRMLDSLAEPRD